MDDDFDSVFPPDPPNGWPVIDQAYDRTEEEFAKVFGSLSRDQVTPEILDNFSPDLALISPRWLLYFTPSFIRIAVDKRHASLEARTAILYRYVPSYSPGDILTPECENILEATFSRKQKGVVAKWLKNMLDDEEFDYERADIEHALSRIWMSGDEQEDEA